MTLAGRPPLSDAQKEAQGTLRAGRAQPGGAISAAPLERLPPAPARFRAHKPGKALAVPSQVQAGPNRPWMDFEQLERLKARARDAWRRFGGEALANRVLTQGDLGALEELAWWWAWALELEERVQLEGPTAFSYSAEGAIVATVTNPLVSVLNSAQVNVQRWLAHFGLTPLARGRVRTAGGGKAEQNPFAELLERRRQMRVVGGRAAAAGGRHGEEA